MKNQTSLRKWVLALVVAITAAVSLSAEKKTVSQGSSSDRRPEIRDLGVPVRGVNWVHLHAGRNRAGEACIYATMGQQAAGLFVLQIDPKTGQLRQHVAKVRGANYPTATLMARSGRLYVGSAYAGHLLCFDPAKDALEDLGAINPRAASFPCRMDEDAQGQIWIGSYGTADLTCYDPASGKFARFGRMDDVDMYNYPLVNSDGMIACLIRMTRPHVVVFDPKSGKKQTVGPVTTAGEGTLDLRKGKDGHLYIVSSVGNFRIEAMEAVPVRAVPESSRSETLADGSAEKMLATGNGSTFFFADAEDQLYRKLTIRKADGQTSTFELNYEASGSDVFCLHGGPDGCIYGSTILPEHLFRYDPKSGEMADMGRCSEATGEAYSMATLDGKIYISSYPGARISVYDPARNYHFGYGEGDNPRDLGRIDDISYRPRSTLAGPLGRVWTASVPDYGRWGGPLSYYDPQTGQKKAYYRIVGDASCYTLAHLEGEKLIAVGTNVSGGSGTRQKVSQAVLFLWDYRAEKKVWEGTLDRPVSAFDALLVGPDRKIYGTVRGGKIPPALFVFDPKSRSFTRQVALPAGNPLDLGLQNGPDGKIYGFTASTIYQVDPGSLSVREILRADGEFDVAGPIVGRDIYFATGHRLRGARIF